MKGPRVVNATSRRSSDQEKRWIYGVNAIQRRLEVNPTSVSELRVAAGSSGNSDEVVRLAKRVGVAVRSVPLEDLARLTQTRSHQGVAALAAAIPYRELDDSLMSGAGPLLILDQIQDPQNFGALLRTAAASGMAAVIVPKHGASPLTPTVEKVSAGAINDVGVCRVPNLSQTLRQLREQGFWSIGLVAHGGQNLFETDLPDRVVLVLGGETGLRPLVERGCDFRLSIPVEPRVESLNASVAGAIAMYELVRRRALTR